MRRDDADRSIVLAGCSPRWPVVAAGQPARLGNGTVTVRAAGRSARPGARSLAHGIGRRAMGRLRDCRRRLAIAGCATGTSGRGSQPPATIGAAGAGRLGLRVLPRREPGASIGSGCSRPGAPSTPAAGRSVAHRRAAGRQRAHTGGAGPDRPNAGWWTERCRRWRCMPAPRRSTATIDAGPERRDRARPRPGAVLAGAARRHPGGRRHRRRAGPRSRHRGEEAGGLRPQPAASRRGRAAADRGGAQPLERRRPQAGDVLAGAVEAIPRALAFFESVLLK